MFIVQIRKVRLREGLGLPKATEWGQWWGWNKNSISDLLPRVTHLRLHVTFVNAEY